MKKTKITQADLDRLVSQKADINQLEEIIKRESASFTVPGTCKGPSDELYQHMQPIYKRSHESRVRSLQKLLTQLKDEYAFDVSE